MALDRPAGRIARGRPVGRWRAELRTTLVVGVTEPASPTTFRNEVVVWGPDGRVVGTFEKVHRVPFGEYVPVPLVLLALRQPVGRTRRTPSPGTAPGSCARPAGPLGLMVSFEVFYADRSRSSVRAGAQLLVVPTNTSSYSTSQVPAQEIAAAIVQAVETGRDLVQAAPTGFTAVVTQRGVVVAAQRLGRRQVVTATVALRRGMTPYDHWGDLPVLLALGRCALVCRAGSASERYS